MTTRRHLFARSSATLCLALLMFGCSAGATNNETSDDPSGTATTTSTTGAGGAITSNTNGSTTGAGGAGGWGGAGGHSSTTAAGGAGGGSSSTSGSTSSSNSTSTSSSSTIQACAAETTKAEQIPLDMLIMLDQSSSMKGQRWTDITTALKQFVDAPGAAGINVALNYFALSRPCPNGNECTSWLGSGASGCSPAKFCKYDDYCSAAAYETPEVAFEALPGVATKIKASLDAHGPYYDTTSEPALQGSVNHAKARGTAFPNHKVVVVFATDGLPESHCEDGNNANDSVAAVAAVASAGLSGSPSIATYVIGVGNSLSQLNQVAKAGGTDKAFLVDQGGSVQADFLKAMNDIRGAALGCTYAIPQPQEGTLDYGKVNVGYTPGGGTEQLINKVDSAADCPPNGDAWYYDNDQSPSTILLCPSTCSKVSADASGTMNVLLGCKTIHQ